MKIIAFLFTAFISLQMFGQEKFPDGTPIPDWFRQNEIVNIETLGKKYTGEKIHSSKKSQSRDLPGQCQNWRRYRGMDNMAEKAGC